ncbi:MAG: hypothetical protein GY755_01410 [Chloroflexi bacterium]|nr:hypothetical protein [Chloroflexota bacterium]
MFKKIALPVIGILLALSIVFGASSVLASEGNPPADDWMEDGDFPDWFMIAAEALNMDDDAFWTAFEDGKTIEEIAKEKGVDAQIIVDAIVAAETEFVKEFDSVEDFSQEEIDEWLEILPEEAKFFVEEGWDFEEFEGADWFTIAGKALGMDEDALWEALEDGKNLADLAKEQGVSQEKVVEAIVAAERIFISEMVTEGELTQEEADEWIAELDEEAKSFVEEGWDFEEFEGADWFSIAGEALNMDEDALWEALEGSKNLADLAKDQGISQEKIIEAILAEEQTFIKEMVTEGELTQEEADEWISELDEEVKFFVEEGWDFEEFEGADWFSIAGEALTMDEDALWEALESGESIADLAKTQGVALEKITDEILSAENEYTAQLLTDGEITQEEADEWNGMLAEELESFANESWDCEEEVE